VKTLEKKETDLFEKNVFCFLFT